MANLAIKDGEGISRYNKAGGAGTDEDPYVPVLDVNIQDQTSPILLVPFHNTAITNSLAVATAIDDMTLTVADGTNFVAEQYLTVYNEAGGRWYQGRILSVATNVITVDTPSDFAYQIGDSVSAGSTNLNVDGSVTPQHFTIRAPDPGIPIVGDITRIILIMETDLISEWNKFGDQTALTNGLVLRKTDGTYQNIFNAKSNSELAAVMYDLDFLDAARFGVYGVKGRLSFGGQNKIGVVIRLEAGEDLELIVQDDLTGLTRLTVIAEGHVVVD